MSIHANLKWQTIVDRLNKKAGIDKFYYDSAYKKIYETTKNGKVLISNCADKQDFLDMIERDYDSKLNCYPHQEPCEDEECEECYGED